MGKSISALFPYILILYATFFWGSTFVLVKASIQFVGIDLFLFVRFLLSTLVMIPLVWYFEGLKIEKKQIMLGGLLGVFLYSSFIFQTVGLSLTTPSKAAFVTGLNVIFVPLVAFIHYKKPIKKIELIAILLSFVGLVLMTLNFTDLVLNVGDLLIVITAIAIAYHIVESNKILKNEVLRILLVQFLVTTILSFLIGIFRGIATQPRNFESIVILTLIITVFFATVFAFFSQFYAQSRMVPHTHVALIFAAEPVFALLIDVSIGIIPSLQVFIGMIITLVAIVLVILSAQSDTGASTNS